MLDRYDLYELCVQSPEDLVPVLVAIHGGSPRILGEDFCGTAAVSVEWTRRIEGGKAIAVDLDGEPLVRIPREGGIEIVEGDVVASTDPRRHQADVMYAGNFSIGERRDRAALLGYLRHVRARLAPGGVFACDLYGGESAFLTGDLEREHPLPDGRMVHHTWEQREADPLTGLVVDALHFRVLHGGEVEIDLRDAFVYRWRLWGVPELREAMIEAGFGTTAVYAKVPDAVDDEGRAYVRAIEGEGALEEDFDVLVTARE